MYTQQHFDTIQRIIFRLLVLGIVIDGNHRIDIKFLSITADSPALRNILNFIGHGGYHCCNFCYIRGVHVEKKRQYFYEKQPVFRHSSTYAKEAAEAEKSKKIFMDIKVNFYFRDSSL